MKTQSKMADLYSWMKKMTLKNKLLRGKVMKLYIKQCRPFQVSLGSQGFSDTWTPLEDWQDEDNENMLREKYPDELLQKKDAWSLLKFQYRYIEYEQ